MIIRIVTLCRALYTAEWPTTSSTHTQLRSLYLHAVAVVRRPDASDGLVDTLHRLRLPLELLAAGVAEQLDLLEDLVGLHIAHADGLLAAVDVLRDDDGVLGRPGGHGELDLGVGGGELGEERLDEAAAMKSSVQEERQAVMVRLDILHPLGATGPVAVVEVHLLALQDEGPDPVLPWR